jgi:protein-L-isoaspartate O-methyltransferase
MNEGGRMVIPMGLDPGTQMVKLITKKGGKLHIRDIEWAHFVLLIGEHGWPVEPAP